MRFADLHLHTFHSDGVRSPRQVVDLAWHHQLQIIAISDHDNLAAIEEASAYARQRQIVVIPAVELSCDYQGNDVHLLGYAFDSTDRNLNDRLARFRAGRLLRGDRIIDRLIEQGVPIDRARVTEICGDGSMGRPHIARVMMEAGVVGSIQEAFEKWLSPGCAGYVEKERFQVSEALETIRRAGGLVSVAHPSLYPKPVELLDALFSAGADAVEALHPEVDEDSAREFQRLARDRGKFVTGGSDDHGFEDLRSIGNIRVPESLIGPILDRL